MEQLKITLRKFGLSDKEIIIYLETLKADNLTPHKLAALTKIPRTTVYDMLMHLSLKGLVELDQSDGYTKQQTLVKAKNPSHLRKIIHQKQNELVGLEVDLVNILPHLKQNFFRANSNTDFQFLPGVEGAIETMNLEYRMKVKATRYIFDNLMPMDNFGPDVMNNSVGLDHDTVAKYGIIVKEIVPLNDWSMHVIGYQVARDERYITTRQLRYVDNPVFEMKLRIAIIEDLVIITCGEEDEIWGLKIKSKALAQSLIAIHTLTWLTAKPITKKLVTSWGPNEYFTAESKKSPST